MVPPLYRFRVSRALVVGALVVLATVAGVVISPGGMVPAYAHSLGTVPPSCMVAASVGQGQQASIVCQGSPVQGTPVIQGKGKIQLGCFMRFAVPVKGLAGFVFPQKNFRKCLMGKGVVVLLQGYMPGDTLGCLVPLRLGIAMIGGRVFPVRDGQQATACLAAKGKLVRLEPTPPPDVTDGVTPGGAVHPTIL